MSITRVAIRVMLGIACVSYPVCAQTSLSGASWSFTTQAPATGIVLRFCKHNWVMMFSNQ
jgi:hypothetical protein